MRSSKRRIIRFRRDLALLACESASIRARSAIRQSQKKQGKCSVRQIANFALSLFSMVAPVGAAQKEQSRVSLRAALTEIEELKQSQRCVEISLAKQIEENEQLTQKLAN